MTTVFLIVLAVLLAAHLVSIALVWARYAPMPRAPRANQPFVSLLRPVCGLDQFDRETLASSFNQDYPDHEVLFCVASPGDPAVAFLEALIAAYPDAKAQVLVGDTVISGNPKLNNLVKGYAATQAEWVIMTDANLLLPQDYLARVMAEWRNDTGLVSAPAAGSRPGNLWGAVECAVLNTSHARWQLAADSLGFGFAQGKTLAWSRSVLEAGGGLPALGDDLAEDVAATKLVRRQGLKVRLPQQLWEQPIGARNARAVWDRHQRWAKIRRAGFPAIYMGEILNGPLVPLLALAGLSAPPSA